MKHPATVLVTLGVINLTMGFGYPPRTPLVSTKSGIVRGVTKYSRGGRQFEAYRGIPFAKPPIGDLRFKAPEPPENWTFPFDARKDGPVCAQKNYIFANPRIEGQEDCLYLNVYTPTVCSERRRGRLLPVMVFIHWGGFFTGRGTSDYLGPEYLMDKDVLLVTFNYRLGVFGFLSSLDDEAPGNFGLKDQILALRWVQDNIEFFGGDKNEVTIFGQSAGAASVHYQLLSPTSKGLFHRAISQSGSALSVFAFIGNAIQPTVLAGQAALVGCQNYIGANKQLINCLRNVSVEALLNSQDQFKVFSVDPLTAWTTVTETKSEANPEPFFVKTPLEIIEAREFQNIPWMVGLVANEGILKASVLLRNSSTREQLNANFDTVLPQLMGYALSTSDPLGLHKNITNEYLFGKNYVNISDPKSIQGFIDLYSDRIFRYSSYQSVLLHAAKGHVPIWFYNFDYRGEYTYGDLFASTNETIDFDWGTSHCDDILYLFRSPGLFPDLRQENDVAMSYLMVDIWTNFAIYGDPNPLENQWTNEFWLPLNLNGIADMKNENLCFMNISGSVQEQIDFGAFCGFQRKRMRFWTNQMLYENFAGLS